MKAKQSLTHSESKTIAFRVSPQDYTEITMRIEISRMVKQDYLLAKALDKEITVYPNCRVQKYLEKYLTEVLKELKRLKSVTADEPYLHKLEDLIGGISKL